MKILDMHCDTIYALLERQRSGENPSLRQNTGHLDLVRMKESGYLLQNFALFVDSSCCEDTWDEVCALHALYKKEMEKNADLIAPVLEYRDIARNEALGKMSAMLTVEEGAVCQGDMSKLYQLYDMGVRMMTLTWNYPNEIGFPNLDGRASEEMRKQCVKKPKEAQKIYEEFAYTPNIQEGLTEFGRELVGEMERLGMIVDVSHLSDKGFYDVLECTRKPFVASHSNAREKCRFVRNLTDDMLCKLAERGGVTGLNYCPDFLTEKKYQDLNLGTIQAVVWHAKYIVEVAGIEVLGLGSDFDGIAGHEELKGAQSMELLWDAMHKAGFTQGQLDKIFYENALRVYRDSLH
ncbi:MAG: dipeptidase [Lachnospiraceae bacterium]|nr:dipeptidase [Lachnospiraceae bacterium]